MLEELTVLCNGATREEWRRTLPPVIAADFPSVFVSIADESASPPHVAAREWQRPDFDTWSFDCRVDELARETFALCVAIDCDDARGVPVEVLNRCQRLVARRNRHSQGSAFERVLRVHAGLHDLSRPLVRADYNHALDTWQWLLRLEPEASLAVQIAALFHDIERLASEADRRVEHLAPDYQAFKDAHAEAGASIALRALAAARVDASVAERAAGLIHRHERPADDPEVALLNDADALSFFSLNSNGYADYFGAEQTQKKVAYTWRRMRDGARRKLDGVRLRPDVKRMLNDVAIA